MNSLHSREETVLRVSKAYSRFPQIESVVLSGSETNATADSDSDLDLYIYTNADVPIEDRRNVAHQFSQSPEVGNTFFEPGDEWIDQKSRMAVDVMFRSIDWIESQIARVLDRYEASIGYSTCFWHNILSSRALFDRNGWFANLRGRANRPFPEPLRRAIINKNFPILRNTQSSYLRQIQRAISRQDSVSIQHRITALLASYFDVLFAHNRIPHPGEKRLVAFAESHCKQLPPKMKDQIQAVIHASHQEIVAHANVLIDGLDLLIRE